MRRWSSSGGKTRNSRAAAEQVAWLLREKGVQTVCVHGDNPRALAFVRELRDALTGLGYRLTTIGRLSSVKPR